MLVPSEVNPENGYRYYAIEQLKTMLFINRLKSQHFSLEEIKSLLDVEEEERDRALYAYLSKKKRDMEENISSLERTLQLIGDDMLNLEKGNSILSYLDGIEVELVEIPDINILYTRRVLGIEECSQGYTRFFGKLYEKIALNKLTVAGKPMTIYHSPEYNPAEYDIEFAIPIKEIVTGTRDFKAGLCVKSIIQGVYTELTPIFAKQREWADSEGYAFQKSPFEIYRKSPESPEHNILPQESVTEFYYPVKKISAGKTC